MHIKDDMKKTTLISTFLILTCSVVFAGNTTKHSVADVMEQHHGLSGPVFFVKANHIEANKKMVAILSMEHTKEGQTVAAYNTAQSDNTPTQRRARKHLSGLSFSDTSERHRNTHSISTSRQSTQASTRYTAFSLTDKATSI